MRINGKQYFDIAVPEIQWTTRRQRQEIGPRINIIFFFFFCKSLGDSGETTKFVTTRFFTVVV